jgi:hypothetical protein
MIKVGLTSYIEGSVEKSFIRNNEVIKCYQVEVDPLTGIVELLNNKNIRIIYIEGYYD